MTDTEQMWIDNLSRLGINRENYIHRMKDRCCVCGHHIARDIERFESIGNFCGNCNSAVSNAMKKV